MVHNIYGITQISSGKQRKVCRSFPEKAGQACAGAGGRLAECMKKEKPEPGHSLRAEESRAQPDSGGTGAETICQMETGQGERQTFDHSDREVKERAEL